MKLILYAFNGLPKFKHMLMFFCPYDFLLKNNSQITLYGTNEVPGKCRTALYSLASTFPDFYFKTLQIPSRINKMVGIISLSFRLCTSYWFTPKVSSLLFSSLILLHQLLPQVWCKYNHGSIKGINSLVERQGETQESTDGKVNVDGVECNGEKVVKEQHGEWQHT